MSSTSNTSNNLLTPTVHPIAQSEAGPSMSRPLVGQAQLPRMTTNQSDAGPSDSRPVTIGAAQIQDNDIGSPLSSSPKGQLTREELQRKIKKYSTRLKEYGRHWTEEAEGKQKARFDSTQKAHQKMVSHMHRRILQQMLMIMEQCNGKGFVFGMVSETSKSMTGASDSLRAWWKRQVIFDKIAPAQIDLYYKENSLYTNMPQVNETKSTSELLMELSDPTLGSILSLLMQHCDPPQRKFPFEQGLRPPWWPTAQEDWWGQTGISRDEGPPPFRKPHDLRKKWKVAVIVGITKSMFPNFSRPYNLVEQSNHLRLRMNAKERKFWTLALVAETKQYCREHPDMPIDEAIAFVETYGSSSSSSSRIAPNLDSQSVSISGNEAPRFGNTTSAWPITVPPMGQPQQGVQLSSTTPNPQMAMSGSFPPQYSPWAFSHSPMLSAHVPMNVQQNRAIGVSGASSSVFQDHHAHAIRYPQFVEQPGDVPSTSGTRDVPNQMHEYGPNMEFGFEPSSGNQNSTSGR